MLFKILLHVAFRILREQIYVVGHFCTPCIQEMLVKYYLKITVYLAFIYLLSTIKRIHVHAELI